MGYQGTCPAAATRERDCYKCDEGKVSEFAYAFAVFCAGFVEEPVKEAIHEFEVFAEEFGCWRKEVDYYNGD